MFETTQDWFYLVAAICSVCVTVFLCWALYYWMRVMRQTDEVMTELREKFARATSVMTFLKNKIVAQGVKGAMSLVETFWGTKKKK